MRKTLVLLVVGMVLIAASAWAVNNQDPIPQGEFAALLASHLNVPKPPGGWTAPEAVSFLSGKGLVPESGAWESGATLNEKDMTHVLRVMGLSIFTSEPDNIVTFAKAYAVFYRYDNFFKRWNLSTKVVQGETTTHIDTAIGGDAAAPVASPATP